MQRMEYAIDMLARLAGVTTRTLRHYHQIGLLTPRRTAGGGVRIYGPEEVDRLQHILFFRQMGLPLPDIRTVLDDPGFDEVQALRRHRQNLLAQRHHLDSLLDTVEATLNAKESKIPMQDKEKFEAFKENLVAQNEEAYGAEAREKYGEEAVEASNAQMMNLSEEAYRSMQALDEEILELLDRCVAHEDPSGPEGRRAAELHRQWLGFTWPSYSKEAHRGLADMYVQDERFSAYYDRGTPGKARFLRDAIYAYTEA